MTYGGAFGDEHDDTDGSNVDVWNYKRLVASYTLNWPEHSFAFLHFQPLDPWFMMASKAILSSLAVANLAVGGPLHLRHPAADLDHLHTVQMNFELITSYTQVWSASYATNSGQVGPDDSNYNVQNSYGYWNSNGVNLETITDRNCLRRGAWPMSISNNTRPPRRLHQQLPQRPTQQLHRQRPHQHLGRLRRLLPNRLQNLLLDQPQSRQLQHLPASIETSFTHSTTASTSTGSSTSRTTSSPAGPTASCDTNGYLIQTSSLYRVNFTTGSTTLVSNTTGAAVNALGYNIFDDCLFGSNYDGTNATLIQIGGTGEFQTIAELPKTGASRNWNMGDVDLKPESSTYGEVVANGTSNPGSYQTVNWAYVPTAGNYLWSLGFTASYNSTELMRWDCEAHSWALLTDLGNIAGNTTWGAIYAGSTSSIIGSENVSGQI
ncbi:hypothetical protein F5Y16DRAFT_402296 [Xylariaceae sp. FL0255]|nr:hypothetical protein F5Y16DRAFT_402296 [Xylariaceae sp. FL0255]